MAVANGELVEIFKARTDKREYRRTVLKNSLEVLLISDPDTDKCDATMDVRVGYFSNPKGLPGLAHFLEHMLFYASEKYPLEDSYSKYIAVVLTTHNLEGYLCLLQPHYCHDSRFSFFCFPFLIRCHCRLPTHVGFHILYLVDFLDAWHGGNTNAFTSSEQTNYHFDINTDCFEEALDR